MSKSNVIIVARKGTRERKFSQYSWDLLGNNKNGWVQVTDQTVTNTATAKPATGQTQTAVKNLGRNIIEVFEDHINKGGDALAVKDFTTALAEAGAALKLSPKSKVAVSLNEAIINAMNAASEQEESESVKAQPQVSAPQETGGLTNEQKSDWIEKNLSELNKTAIKDYFDGMNIEYKSNANLDALKTQLAEHFGYDVKKLQEAIG